MHAVIVRDVIAPVAIGRGMDRRQPDRVDAKIPNVIELGNQAGEIALPVAVRVAERADVDLVDDGATPPRRRRHAQTSDAELMTLVTRPYFTASSAPIQKLRSVSRTTFS